MRCSLLSFARALELWIALLILELFHALAVCDWHSCGETLSGKYPRAELCLGHTEHNTSSSDYCAHTGDTVYGRCMVSNVFVNDTPGFNISNISIQVDRWNCGEKLKSPLATSPQFLVKPVGSRTVIFRLTNVSRYHEGFYQCYYDWPTPPLLDNIFLDVGNKPLKPHLEHIIILNWKEVFLRLSPSYEEQMLNVHPCPEEENNPFDLEWNISYSLSDRHSKEWRQCDNKRRDISCRFELSDFQHGMNLSLKVTLRNKVDELEWRLDDVNNLENYIKPGNVSNLQATNVTSTSMHLTWDSPNHHHAILYNITMNAKGHQHMRHIKVTNETQVTILGLLPNAVYKIRVSAKPLHYGLTGDEQHIKEAMKPDVPGIDPVLIPGGYDRASGHSSEANFTVYWKPIPHSFTNGDINYVLILNKEKIVIDGKCTSHSLPALKKGQNAKILLYATNKNERIGRNKSLPGTVLEIPVGDKLDVTVRHEVFNETHKRMTWNVRNDDVKVYVVIGTEGTADGNCDVQGAMSYQMVDSGTTSIHIANAFRSGIGIRDNGRDRGIFWSSQLFSVPDKDDDTAQNPSRVTVITIAVVVTLPLVFLVGLSWFLWRRKISEEVPIKKVRVPSAILVSAEAEESFDKGDNADEALEVVEHPRNPVAVDELKNLK